MEVEVNWTTKQITGPTQEKYHTFGWWFLNKANLRSIIGTIHHSQCLARIVLHLVLLQGCGMELTSGEPC